MGLFQPMLDCATDGRTEGGDNVERLTLRDDDGRALLTPYGLRIYCSTQATADCICKLEETLKAQEPREIPPAQWDAWKDDAWAENLETGEITAINRTAVAAWVKYIRHDSYAHWKLWTGRPKGNE